MDEPISGGDIGRFSYCALNWKLSLAGHRGAGGKQGMREHDELSHQVDALEFYQSRARLTQDTALLMALFATSAASLGIEFLLLQVDSPLWWILVFLSVIWAAVSLYLVVFNLYYKSRAKDVVHASRIAKGEVAFADSPRHAAVYGSKVIPLRGRPDYVVEREGVHIPVEYKSGRTPPRPYDSHVLQLAAYCYLVGEAHGKRPPVGILHYADREFEIPYTEELEDRLLKTILRIQLAQRTGDVHRSHENPRRCLGCSRRDVCPEKLA